MKLFPSLYSPNAFAEVLRDVFPLGQDGRTIYHRRIDRSRIQIGECHMQEYIAR